MEMIDINTISSNLGPTESGEHYLKGSGLIQI